MRAHGENCALYRQPIRPVRLAACFNVRIQKHAVGPFPADLASRTGQAQGQGRVERIKGLQRFIVYVTDEFSGNPHRFPVQLRAHHAHDMARVFRFFDNLHAGLHGLPVKRLRGDLINIACDGIAKYGDESGRAAERRGNDSDSLAQKEQRERDGKSRRAQDGQRVHRHIIHSKQDRKTDCGEHPSVPFHYTTPLASKSVVLCQFLSYTYSSRFHPKRKARNGHFSAKIEAPDPKSDCKQEQ